MKISKLFMYVLTIGISATLKAAPLDSFKQTVQNMHDPRTVAALNASVAGYQILQDPEDVAMTEDRLERRGQGQALVAFQQLVKDASSIADSKARGDLILTALYIGQDRIDALNKVHGN